MKLAPFFLVAMFFVCFGTTVSWASDSLPPVSYLELFPTFPSGDNGWYHESVNALVSSSDSDSGVSSVSYRLNNGGYTVVSFQSPINLQFNSSFEEALGSSWSFVGTGALEISPQDFIDGLKSAKITGNGGVSCLSGVGSYIPIKPSESYSVSTFIKGANISGVGGFFRVYLINSGSSTLLGSSSFNNGSFNWKKIGGNFYISENSQATGMYVDLCLNGTGDSYFDLVYITKSALSQVEIPVYKNGENALNYFATDTLGNIEISRLAKIKIDTRSPSNWGDFSATRSGNAHTYSFSVSNMDLESGLKSGSGKYQYSLDNGATFGAYSNINSCRGSFLTDKWLSLSSNNFLDGTKSKVTFSTDSIDFCNSNWNLCKIIRFEVEDVSGRTSTNDICLNGSRFKTTGSNIYAFGNISQSSPSSFCSSYFVSGKEKIENCSSDKMMYLFYYENSFNLGTFTQLLASFPDITVSKIIPEKDGLWLIDGNYSISSNTIPAKVKNGLYKPVIFVDGTLTINSDISIANGGGIIFIVSGGVEIDKKVETLNGIFYSFDDIDTSYNGSSAKDPLTIRGSLYGKNVSLTRQISKVVNSDPSEAINFDPSYLINFRQYFGVVKKVYKII